ncbi:25015_t:CDS:2, partial [Racocetra persica]
VTINDNFAKLSEALFTADRHAREEHKKPEKKGDYVVHLIDKVYKYRINYNNIVTTVRAGISSTTLNASESDSELSRMGAEQRAKYLAREQNRDISEKIALGLAKPTLSKDSLYDSRLFNQSEGLSSGFKDDEVYDLYDKPLFASSSSTSIYNPKKNYDTDQYGGGDEESINRILSVDRFGIASKGFQGADKSRPRDGPVEFEKEEADPFGFNQFLDDAKKGSKRGLET